MHHLSPLWSHCGLDRSRPNLRLIILRSFYQPNATLYPPPKKGQYPEYYLRRETFVKQRPGSRHGPRDSDRTVSGPKKTRIGNRKRDENRLKKNLLDRACMASPRESVLKISRGRKRSRARSKISERLPSGRHMRAHRVKVRTTSASLSIGSQNRCFAFRFLSTYRFTVSPSLSLSPFHTHRHTLSLSLSFSSNMMYISPAHNLSRATVPWPPITRRN